MGNSILHVYFNQLTSSSSSSKRCFVITEELKNETTDWHQRLSSADISCNGYFSYDAFWPHLSLASQNKLEKYLSLYSILKMKIDKNDINQIVTHDLDTGYQNVIDDIAAEFDLSVIHTGKKSDEISLLQKFLISVPILKLIIDQFYVILKNSLPFQGLKLKNNILVFPFTSRRWSMIPVMKRVNSSSDVIVSPLTLSWRVTNPRSDWPDEIETNTYTEFATLSTVCDQLMLFLKLQGDVLLDRLELEKKLERHLRKEYNVKVPATIGYVVKKTLREDIRTVLTLPLIDDIVGKSEASKVIVGSDHPRDRHTILTANRQGLQTYYIPHSIWYHDKPLPPMSGTIHYVAGEADLQFLKQRYSEDALSTVKPLGRPHFSSLDKERATKTREEGIDRVIVATQPYPDWIRKQFCLDVIRVLNKINYDGEVIIKVHPNERVSYYSSMIDGIDVGFHLTVADGDMATYISPGSAVFTINSNVGIESILMGAISISYNPTEPFTQPSSYIDGDVIPYATNKNELKTILGFLLAGEYSQIEQLHYIELQYELEGAASRIAQDIVSD